MDFTYAAYERLLAQLTEQGYPVADYHDYAKFPRCVILRHDIDTSLEQAVRLAELEHSAGAKSTYFVLLRTDFYNPASKAGQAAIGHIHALGHEIGLHFDELAYAPSGDVPAQIAREAAILSELCGFPITTVSMHRPSSTTLEANYCIPGLVNSYGQTFFHDFKYLSDSRRHWREPVEDIIQAGEYDRLHILTHAFWYHEKEEIISDTVGQFIRGANRQRYLQMAENIPFTFTGNEQDEVERFSSLSHYRAGTFTWIKKQESIPVDTDLTAIRLAFVSEEVLCPCPNIIQTPQSKHAFFCAMEHFYAQEEHPAVGQFTYLSPRVKMGKNVRIGHNCTLDGDIAIGDNTVIWNNVVIVNRVTIGQDCEIQSGTVIGHDGFGYTEDEQHQKTMVKHFGGVSIGNRVHLGMNNVIARGTIDDTVVMDGVKMADLCHVGHNNIIEKNVSFISGCVVNGSCRIYENAYIATSILRNQCTIGENAFVGLGAVVVKDVAPNETVVGNPARPFSRKKD